MIEFVEAWVVLLKCGRYVDRDDTIIRRHTFAVVVEGGQVTVNDVPAYEFWQRKGE